MANRVQSPLSFVELLKKKYLGEGGAEGLLEQLISVKNVSERKN
jgi:hypothetical protein